MTTPTRAEVQLDFVDRSATAFASLNSSFERARAGIGRVAGAFSAFTGLFAGAAFVAGAKTILDQAEGFNKLSQRTGVATETLSAWAFAAKLADVEQADLATGLKKLALNMVAAAGGAKEQAEIFKALGLSLKDAGGNLKGTDAVLREIAAKFETFEDGPEKAALAVALFGKAGDQLIPFLNNLRATEEEARRFAGIVGPEFAKAAEQFNDNLKRMGELSERLKVTLVGGVIGSLADLSEEMLAAARAAGSLTGAFALWLSLSGEQMDDPKRALDDINARLERMTKLRDELDPKKSVANRLNDWVFGDVADLDRSIALLERQRDVLRSIASTKAYRGVHSPEEDLIGRGRLGRAPTLDRRPESTTRSPFQQAIEQLEVERDKVDNLTRAQEVLAAIERERYGKLSESQRLALLGIAEEIDAINRKKGAEKAYLDFLTAMEEENAKLAEIEVQRRKSKADEIARITSGTKIARIEELRRQRALVEDEILSDRDPSGKVHERLNQIDDEIAALGERAKNTSAIYQDFGLTLSSAFSKAVIEGEKLRDVVVGLGKDLLQILAREYALKPLASGISAIFQAAISGIFGGGGAGAGALHTAGGGDRRAGRPLIVGESGPELWIPRTAGFMVPNGGLGGRATVNNFNLSVTSSGNPQTDGQAILATIVPVIKAVTRDTLVQESRIGGLLSPA